MVEILRLALKHNNYYNAGSEDIGLLVPEAQPRDTNNREVLYILITMGCRRFIMVQSVAEGPEICQYGLFLEFSPAVAQRIYFRVDIDEFHHGTDIPSINRNQYFSTDMYFKVVVDNFDILILKVISTVDIGVILGDLPKYSWCPEQQS